MTIGDITALAGTLVVSLGLLFTGFWAVFRRYIEAKFELMDFKFVSMDKRLDETNRAVTQIQKDIAEIKENQVKALAAQQS